jgi:hypothetical protein
VRYCDAHDTWSTWSQETSFTTVPDLSPPVTPIVADDGDSTTHASYLRATWSSSDSESGIAEYQYAVGTSAGETDVVDWTSAGTETEATCAGISLSPGVTYYFGVKAKNGHGVWSEVGVSNGITVEDIDETDGGAGDCTCVSVSGDLSSGELLLGWAITGLCWGTGYCMVRRIRPRKRG